MAHYIDEKHSSGKIEFMHMRERNYTADRFNGDTSMEKGDSLATFNVTVYGR